MRLLIIISTVVAFSKKVNKFALINKSEQKITINAENLELLVYRADLEQLKYMHIAWITFILYGFPKLTATYTILM